MCENCTDGTHILNSTADFSGIEFALIRAGESAVIRCRVLRDEGFEEQDLINIPRCPFCGEKFGGRRRDTHRDRKDSLR